jgi:hypothetical protein
MDNSIVNIKARLSAIRKDLEQVSRDSSANSNINLSEFLFLENLLVEDNLFVIVTHKQNTSSNSNDLPLFSSTVDFKSHLEIYERNLTDNSQSPDRNLFIKPTKWPRALVASKTEIGRGDVRMGNFESFGSLWQFKKRGIFLII